MIDTPMSIRETRTMILLHTAVFLAGWTGILGRVISLDGLPLVWYRMMVSVVVLVSVLALMRRLHRCRLHRHPGRAADLQPGRSVPPGNRPWPAVGGTLFPFLYPEHQRGPENGGRQRHDAAV